VDAEADSKLAKVEIGGAVKTIQVLGESDEGVLTLQMHGRVVDCCVRSVREFSLSRHMIEPPAVDTSLMLLSPMPGKLISVAVQPGDEIELGQEMCVVEAMKMQNVMRSERKGVVKSVDAKVNDSLKVDQVIVTFEGGEEETA
jgi:propionyl-CoA carboxylase alpha chain